MSGECSKHVDKCNAEDPEAQPTMNPILEVNKRLVLTLPLLLLSQVFNAVITITPVFLMLEPLCCARPPSICIVGDKIQLSLLNSN